MQMPQSPPCFSLPLYPPLSLHTQNRSSIKPRARSRVSTRCLRPALAFAGAHAFASGTHAPGRCIAHTHTHTYAQRWWGGKGARWVNRVSAKRWVAISEFLVGKHRHDGPWSRLRAQSCIGDSIGEEGGEKGERRLCRGGFSNGRLVFFESLPIRRPSVFQYIYTHAFPRLAILALLPCTLLWWMRFVSAWISG